jgi:putative DNA primase/helicase
LQPDLELVPPPSDVDFTGIEDAWEVIETTSTAVDIFDQALKSDKAQHGRSYVAKPDPTGPMAGVDGFHYTDKGNADRLLTNHRGLLRFVPRWRAWLTYDGKRWSRDHGDTFVAHLASEIGQQLIARVPDVYHSTDKLKPLLAAVRRIESAAGITATLQVASTVPDVAIDHEVLDADAWLLNVDNGTINLETGQLREHDPTDLLTMKAAVAYSPDAEYPQWARFLEQVLPDPDVRAFVQRVAGLALLGGQPEHILIICIGIGANGKSTLTRVLADVLGDYAVVASRDLLVAMQHDSHPTSKADLFRRRFAHSGELPAGAKLNEAQVKELTGDDKVKARRMREDFWEFDPSHLLWLHANHRPQIEGTDDGIWRRVMLIPFDVQIPKEDRDANLAQRIVKEEGPGVLRWMLEGLAAWQANGLGVPPIVEAATADYRNESDTVATFIDECHVVYGPNESVDSSILLALHGEWFAASGSTESEAGHYQRVVAHIKEHGAVTARTKARGRYWQGVSAGGDGG